MKDSDCPYPQTSPATAPPISPGSAVASQELGVLPRAFPSSLRRPLYVFRQRLETHTRGMASRPMCSPGWCADGGRGLTAGGRATAVGRLRPPIRCAPPPYLLPLWCRRDLRRRPRPTCNNRVERAVIYHSHMYCTCRGAMCWCSSLTRAKRVNWATCRLLRRGVRWRQRGRPVTSHPCA